ncbi:alcohol dehydrogenase catalytic domain-containing protein [Kushneria aurantia]|uniref:Alcohol dehydrogenase catalytic domain-containing protein n=1 Tax=Kushneria aurantia TaxID=504092 RepID=A0ABV6G399_9GAMM|nr:alcohol dehydrogenase catalytic domain-containing protein [Kushneria aurantia]
MTTISNMALRYHRFGSPPQVLQLESQPIRELPADGIRVTMLRAPLNPSDLIPISGAYRHRVALPQTAGHEGVGMVSEAPQRWRHLLGRRVLPLRGAGTWCCELVCDPALAVPVPNDINDDLAARAFINPMAVLTMLDRWPVTGKRLLLTAAGSNGARLLAQWALHRGARSVTGIVRSEVHREPLTALGLTVLNATEHDDIRRAAAHAELIFDAVGGPLAEQLLMRMPADALMISWGLLSGVAPRRELLNAQVCRFHLRDVLIGLTADDWV